MTTAKTRGRPPALPAIILSQEDFDALDRLVGDLPGAGPAGLLQQELDRAKVRAQFDKRFTSRRMAEDYVKVYERLIAERKAGLS